MSKSGYRNGQLIYPVSVVDHNETLVDPQLEELENNVDTLLEWMEEETTVHEDVFYIGGGATYADVLDDNHMVGVKKSMKTNVNVTLAEGDNIIIVLTSAFRPNFIRADVNGSEIAFTETDAEVSGVAYKVLTSDNTFQAGTYNIDINS